MSITTITYVNKDKAIARYEDKMKTMRRLAIAAVVVAVTALFVPSTYYAVIAFSFSSFGILYTMCYYPDTKKRLQDTHGYEDFVATEDVYINYISNGEVPAIAINGHVWQYKKVPETNDIVVNLHEEIAYVPDELTLPLQ